MHSPSLVLSPFAVAASICTKTVFMYTLAQLAFCVCTIVFLLSVRLALAFLQDIHTLSFNFGKCAGV